MAKPIIYLKTEDFSRLKRKVELEFGLPIRSKKDCLNLAKEIQSRTKETISQSTIYRLFFQANKHHPYQHTLDTISRYCGYNSIHDLISDLRIDRKIEASIGAKIDSFEISQNLLFQCIQNLEFLSIESYLNSLPIELSIENKCIIGYTIFQSLKKSPKSEIPFYKKFHLHPVIRECFFELMADPNFELPNYNQGIELYLTPCHDLSISKNLEAYVFANSLRARYFFTQHKIRNFNKYFNKTLKAIQSHLLTYDSISLFPKLRAQSLEILHASFKNEATTCDEKLKNLVNDIHMNLNKLSILEKRIACYILLETMQFVHCDEAFIQKFLSRFENDFHFKMKQLSISEILESIQPNGLLYRNNITT